MRSSEEIMRRNTDLSRRTFLRLACGFLGTLVLLNCTKVRDILRIKGAQAGEESTASLPLSWKIRKAFWNGFTMIKYRGATPTPILVPVHREREVKLIPFKSYFPSIPITKVLVADHVPEDEAQPLKRLVIDLQLWLLSKYPTTQEGLPEVSQDPAQRLKAAYSGYRATLFPPPRLPSSFKIKNSAAMLGRLAVEGPFAGYLEKDEYGFHWDLSYLNDPQFTLHDGLERIGTRVEFSLDETSKSLHASAIETFRGRYKPNDRGWAHACKLALCGLSNDIAIVRHFNWVHLVNGSIVAVVTRNHLGANHPIRRLLWPHTYGTQYSNDMVTEVQMASSGDFAKVFSFTSEGLNALFETTYSKYRIETSHPALDAVQRGISNVGFETPSQDNCEELFEICLNHAHRYLGVYYPEDLALRSDAEVSRWLMELEMLIPNGVAVIGKGKSLKERVAELCASIIYLGSVQHETLGSSLWNYQLWTHIMPCRVYSDGRRESVDVYQQLLNSNFILQTSRTQIMEDFSYLAVDEKGKHLWKQFRAELGNLNQEMRRLPDQEWKIYPDILEANINT